VGCGDGESTEPLRLPTPGPVTPGRGAGLAATADGTIWNVADGAAYVVHRIDAAAGAVGTLAGQH
jgi:hypothetical protein